MTRQEKLRKSIKYRVMRQIWIRAGQISRWAGKRIIAWMCTADKQEMKSPLETKIKIAYIKPV